MFVAVGLLPGSVSRRLSSWRPVIRTRFSPFTGLVYSMKRVFLLFFFSVLLISGCTSSRRYDDRYPYPSRRVETRDRPVGRTSTGRVIYRDREGREYTMDRNGRRVYREGTYSDRDRRYPNDGDYRRYPDGTYRRDRDYDDDDDRYERDRDYGKNKGSYQGNGKKNGHYKNKGKGNKKN